MIRSSNLADNLKLINLQALERQPFQVIHSPDHQVLHNIPDQRIFRL